MSKGKQRIIFSYWPYLVFGLGMLLLFYFLDQGENLRRSLKFVRQASSLNGLIYFGWFILSGMIFISWLFAKAGWWRLLAFITLGITFFFEFAGQYIAGEGVSYHGILQIEQNRGFSLDNEVWDSFGMQFVLVGILTLLLLAAIFLIQKKFLKGRISHWLLFLLPLIGFMGSYLLIQKTQANRIDFPFPYKVIDVYAYAKLNGLYLGDRQPVALESNSTLGIDHIVLIVDESIRGDYLSINGNPDGLTPFLAAADSLILNYGVASSGGVCSNYSNVILLSGATVNDLPDEEQAVLHQPNIFQYAEQANFAPNILYSIGYPDHPSGFWSAADMRTAGKKWFVHDQYPNAAGYERDRKALTILEQITTGPASFTYFLKYGAHFHFENSYPEDRKKFQPTQDVGNWDKNNRTELVNSYKNAVDWNVNEFFKTIQEKFAGQNILFVYTSDHGQNLMDVAGVKLTHCAKGPAPKEMATVPIFLYSPNPAIIDKIKHRYRPTNKDHASHFNIFPTLLELFGYQNEELRAQYDPSLFMDLKNSKRQYSSGDIFGRSEMYWNEFD